MISIAYVRDLFSRWPWFLGCGASVAWAAVTVPGPFIDGARRETRECCARGSRAAVPALPGPLSRCPQFPGHSLIHGARREYRGHSRAGRAMVPKVTVPGPQGAAAGARQEPRECPARGHGE
ncbi:unnamed protein product [Boreogadus saida]